MIIRAIFITLLVFGGFFALFWAAFRTRYFTRRRVKEVAKTGSILVASTISTAVVVAFIMVVEKL